MTSLSSPLESLQPAYDAVVVGSGYGGGVAASRLARAGLAVAVLERGKEYATGSFPKRFPEVRAEMMMSGGASGVARRPGLYDVRLGEHIHVLVGCGVGGGSLVNAGVALRPDARVFADPRFPEALRGDGLLDEGFRRAAAWLRPATDPRAAGMTKLRALAAVSAAVGPAPVAAPVAVSFADTVSAGGLAQPACSRCGDCCGGCNVGAKNTVAMTYLPDAVAAGAAIFATTAVSHVEPAGGGWRVHWQSLGGEGTGAIEARIVILAAGTLGSTEILLRSGAAGLPLSGRLGHGFSANGDIIAFAANGRARVNAVGIGHPARDGLEPPGASVTGEIEIGDDDDLDLGMIIQEGVLPSALAPLLPVLFVPGGRLIGAAQALLKGVYDGPLARTQTFFVVSHDSARGQIVLRGGRSAIHWPDVVDEPVYGRVDAALGKLAKAAGAVYIKNPLSGTVLGKKPATAHPLGGCGMAADAERGVVDDRGRVFAGSSGTEVHDGLYVTDGSVLPRSLGVNPLLSITAIAERCMLLLAETYRLEFDVAPRPGAE